MERFWGAFHVFSLTDNSCVCLRPPLAAVVPAPVHSRAPGRMEGAAIPNLLRFANCAPVTSRPCFGSDQPLRASNRGLRPWMPADRIGPSGLDKTRRAVPKNC